MWLEDRECIIISNIVLMLIVVREEGRLIRVRRYIVSRWGMFRLVEILYNNTDNKFNSHNNCKKMKCKED